MGATIEQIWIRKPARAKEPTCSEMRIGPGPRITIPASGF
ncbi:hypothetical protein GCM10010987_80210 [Bradyrhizobium guangdongense]|uniref:Uncharacterized protein n=1 Tax=Bradyrhizobium guangdongense TaxID=1325090 RepID=A0AA87WH43_9BRAD|nr:hypothetical protein GCM10010987_80210 [Bradyrhizobium guangdongense]